jgi:L-fuconolactonase
MKVSGMLEQSTILPAPKDPDFYAPTFEVLWSAFGEERLIFGSNWPVCERGGDYATAVAVVDAFFSSKGPRARDRCFSANGRRVYGWIERN